jgi:hypothetical protein
MDDLQKLYLENRDPNQRIKTKLEEIHRDLGLLGMKYVALRETFMQQGASSLAVQAEDDRKTLMEILERQENYLERYFPGMYNK